MIAANRLHVLPVECWRNELILAESTPKTGKNFGVGGGKMQ